MILLSNNLNQHLFNHRFLFLVTVSCLFYFVGNGALWFVLPLMLNASVNDYFWVGFFVSLPNIVSFVLDVPLGCVFDFIGRRRPLFCGLVLMALMGFLLPLVSSFFGFMLFLALFGFANQLIYISARAYVMDISPKGKSSTYFGFVAPPQRYFVALFVIAGSYFYLVQIVKSWFVRKFGFV